MIPARSRLTQPAFITPKTPQKNIRHTGQEHGEAPPCLGAQDPLEIPPLGLGIGVVAVVRGKIQGRRGRSGEVLGGAAEEDQEKQAGHGSSVSGDTGRE